MTADVMRFDRVRSRQIPEGCVSRSRHAVVTVVKGDGGGVAPGRTSAPRLNTIETATLRRGPLTGRRRVVREKVRRDELDDVHRDHRAGRDVGPQSTK